MSCPLGRQDPNSRQHEQHSPRVLLMPHSLQISLATLSHGILLSQIHGQELLGSAVLDLGPRAHYLPSRGYQRST
jgi:hypothetical protein